jgi:guanosine-3',5'-bis(diphosphate) 3'-pyrophosphohydrolase
MINSCDLIDKIKKYQTNFNELAVLDAYNFSLQAHSLQTRSSGDPYFSHPLAVAEILIDLKLDTTSIITALLHDVVEDTPVTLEIIEKRFGEEVANLVDGVTKLSKIESMPTNQKAAENFRKLVMAMSQDIRVLIVKLSDRLHNMRTINFIKSEEKRVKISTESLAIYAPLAARIGMYKIRDELQELSFEQINPDSRKYIVEKLEELKESKRDVVEKIIEDLRLKISGENNENNIKFEISGRQKQPYSIWNKMKSHNVGFGYLYDIMAFRIVVENLADCYRVLGLINCNYNMIPGSFKDYISTPKENGYRSLHLSALGPQNKKIEVQIRTREMHQNAELGVAAHWSYKENIRVGIENEQYKWIRELISLFEQMGDASEVLKNYKIQMHDDQVFCFTPNGDIFNLPVGATIIDFAYAVHSEIGNSCVSCKVNGMTTTLRQKLDNGDQVEIITDKNAKPNPAWLQFAITSKAKVAIKHFMRNEKYAEYSALGKAILYKFFASKSLEINDKLLEGILKNFNKKTLNDLYVFVAEGLVTRNDILKIVYPDYQDESQKNPKKAPPGNNKTTSKDEWFKKSATKHALPIDGLVAGMAIHLATCCHPIPGDEIVGIISTGVGVTIHSRTCRNLKTVVPNPQRLLEVCWKHSQDDDLYQSRIMIVMHNTSGSLAEVSSAIAKKKINITNIQINSRSVDFFEVIIDMEVKNTEHLENIMSSLRMSKKIVEVSKI